MGRQWKRVGFRHHHGIDVPLFSLHSKNSCGIGEFTDLIPLLNWCKEVGMDTIQLLPLNDTGPESSPYSAISAFALNPIHLGLTVLPGVEKHPELLSQIKELQKLTKSKRVDYQKVRPAKYLFFREYHHFEGQRIIESSHYQEFIESHPWIFGYALFKALKVSKRWRSWKEWEAFIRPPNQETFNRLCKEFSNEIHFHIFLQYLCFQQFQSVSDQAKEKGIFLKGDIPILISPESADVWLRPEIFHMGYTAGSPPDMYTPDGQNWGSPIYNWSELKKRDFDWWRARLQVSQPFYDICRLDHIIGFFRIWAIPPGEGAMAGRYLPEDRSTWLQHGEAILKMIAESTNMLSIGEDLGDIPDSVRDFMAKSGICGTKVMRWERKGTTTGPFFPLDEYHPISMTTVSTHDSDTNHQWWKNSPDEVEELVTLKGWKYSPELTEEYQFELLKDSHTSSSLFHINLLQEYLTLFEELRWGDIDDERVNYPGTVSPINWSIRYKPSVEEITTHRGLKEKIKALTSNNS